MPMPIGAAFPSPWTRAQDLAEWMAREGMQFITLTLEAVKPYHATNFDTREPEVQYQLTVREFRRPIKLKATLARLIGDALQEQDMERWYGRRIDVWPAQEDVFGTMRWVLKCDPARGESAQQPQLPPKQDLNHLLNGNPLHQLAAGPFPHAQDPRARVPIVGRPPVNQLPPPVPHFDATPMDLAVVDDFRGALQTKGKTWDDFLRFLKPRGLLDKAWGVAFDAVPKGLRPAMTDYWRSLAAGETVSPATGEVTDGPPSAALPVGPPAAAAPAAPRNFGPPGGGFGPPAAPGGFSMKPPPPAPAQARPPDDEDDIPF
jgi:hypothetical protein